ncbi:MAG: leucyl aminopeptidase [Campylobacterales bacterium]|nr:leucyl aminopeptidase [Campylobacterales bacterium]
MEIKINERKIKNSLEVIFIIKKNLQHPFIKEKALLKKMGFKGEQDEIFFDPHNDRLYVGVTSFEHSDFRSAAAVAARDARTKEHYNSLRIATYTQKKSDMGSMQGIIEGLLLGNYSFTTYKSKSKKDTLKKIYISQKDYSKNIVAKKELERVINEAMILAEAVNKTRDIINTPPDDCYPKILADIAKDTAKKCNLECTILEQKEIKKENMGALLAVARASRHEPRVIHLAHTPKNVKKKVILVGKGLTYDSGGLSLKPSDFMTTMKSDKSGGSAIIGIMQAISKLNLPIEVHGFVGAVENMIGGDAYKPDDVLISKSGKTIEVKNTDAEGRLVLADVLTYAQQEVKADYIFDLATLTGACVVALGEYTSGIMGFGERPKKLLKKASLKSGEMSAELPFNRHLAKLLKSEIADICNISSSRYGGAITAGLFLSNFIEEKNKNKWCHIDIAGPAFVQHAWGENPYGASGAGVRLIVSLLKDLTR